jgi:YrbI family 3-deoxy-D-manno-octulosonate 8-phosphate phosphatase
MEVSPIKMIVLDVDGTLTDGGIYVTDSGEEFKKFNVKDGMAITRLRKKGMHFGLISGSKSTGAIYKRAENLGVEFVYVGEESKTGILEKWLDELGITYDNVLFMGDDLSDNAVMQRAAIAACPADAAPSIVAMADIVTKKKGGEGCFRELADKYFPFD